MIELTAEQRHELETQPTEVLDPQTNQVYVLIRKEQFERIQDLLDYDDSPWTSEERHTLAWEAGKHAGWEDMDEYDDLPEKP